MSHDIAQGLDPSLDNGVIAAFASLSRRGQVGCSLSDDPNDIRHHLDAALNARWGLVAQLVRARA